jgi:hypothetical protein
MKRNPQGHEESIFERRRTWMLDVQPRACGGGWRGVARSGPYELSSRAPNAVEALEQLRAEVDAFDEMLGRLEPMRGHTPGEVLISEVRRTRGGR